MLKVKKIKGHVDFLDLFFYYLRKVKMVFFLFFYGQQRFFKDWVFWGKKLESTGIFNDL